MSLNPVTTYTRAATRKEGEKLNILTAPTHENFETYLAKTGHNFYAYQTKGFKDWKTQYRPTPENYTLLPADELPLFLELDLVLSQNKFGQYQVLSQIANRLQLPLVSLEHTTITNQYLQDNIQQLKNMRGDANVFITEYSRSRWGWNPKEARVIKHCVDTDIFFPMENKKPQILSVANDFINRGPILGFNQWKYVVSGLPFVVLGDTPGLSKPSESVEHLVKNYQESLIFLNTSITSPIPSVMLEAAACECIIVTTNNCAIPEFFEDGVNAYFANDAEQMKQICISILANPEKHKHIGKNARQMIIDKCGVDRFTGEWNEVFNEVIYK